MMMVESVRAILRARRGRPAEIRRPGSHIWIHGLPLKMRFKTSKIYVSVIPIWTIGFVIGFIGADHGHRRRLHAGAGADLPDPRADRRGDRHLDGADPGDDGLCDHHPRRHQPSGRRAARAAADDRRRDRRAVRRAHRADASAASSCACCSACSCSRSACASPTTSWCSRPTCSRCASSRSSNERAPHHRARGSRRPARGCAAPAAAERLVSTLSTSRVLIASNFTGADVVLFGSVERDAQTVARRGGYDIVVTVTGPRETIVTFRKAARRRHLGQCGLAHLRQGAVLSHRARQPHDQRHRRRQHAAAHPDRARAHAAAAGDRRRHRGLDPRRSVPPGLPAPQDRPAALRRAAERRHLPHPGAVPRHDPDPRQRADRRPTRSTSSCSPTARCSRARRPRSRSSRSGSSSSSPTRRATTACSTALPPP